MALLRFKQAYQQAGVELSGDELPDHLCVVLEFAATVDFAAGRQLLLDHRGRLELLRLSLRDDGSPWMPLLDLVCRQLPALPGDEHEAVRGSSSSAAYTSLISSVIRVIRAASSDAADTSSPISACGEVPAGLRTLTPPRAACR